MPFFEIVLVVLIVMVFGMAFMLGFLYRDYQLRKEKPKKERLPNSMIATLEDVMALNASRQMYLKEMLDQLYTESLVERK